METIASGFADSLHGLDFYGFYASANWFPTGESRPYDRFKGCFNRVAPRHNFNFGRGGAWGAFELSTRFSCTDLTDDDVNGGKLSLLMGESNWYLHSHVRLMFNGVVDTSPAAPTTATSTSSRPASAWISDHKVSSSATCNFPVTSFRLSR